jgi:hypothetical protein
MRNVFYEFRSIEKSIFIFRYLNWLSFLLRPQGRSCDLFENRSSLLDEHGDGPLLNGIRLRLMLLRIVLLSRKDIRCFGKCIHPSQGGGF